MVAVSFFWINIYRYGIFYAVSFLFAYFFIQFVAQRQYLKQISPKIHDIIQNQIDNLFLVAMIWVIFWWRLWHFAIYYPWQLIQDPIVFFQIRNGWMSFIWWAVWVFVWVFLFCKYNKIWFQDIKILFDLIVCIAPFGIMLGRFGNFLNQELYWRPVLDVLPWISDNILDLGQSFFIFYKYPNIDDLLRFNTNLLAGFFEWFLILILMQFLFWKKYKKFIWLLWPIRLLIYSFFRFCLEYLRQDSYYEFVWPFSKSQWFFVVFMIICIFWIISHYKNLKK